MKYKIAVLIGSLRKESYNRKAAENLIRLAPDSLEMEIVEIGQLPFYNEDLETDNPPEEWIEFRQKIREFDGVFLFTPEYNRSISAVLKNALDVGSRPKEDNVWARKPTAVASVSIGGIGGAIANHTLRQSLVFLDMPVMQQPEIYLGPAADLFDEEGKVVASSEEFFKKAINAYAEWVEKIHS